MDQTPQATEGSSANRTEQYRRRMQQLRQLELKYESLQPTANTARSQPEFYGVPRQQLFATQSARQLQPVLMLTARAKENHQPLIFSKPLTQSKRVDELRQQNETLQHKFKQVEMHLHEVQSDCTHLTACLSRLQDHNDRHQQRLAETEHAKAELSHHHNNLTAQTNQATAEIDNLIQLCTHAQQRKTLLQSSNSEAQALLDTIESDINLKSEAVAELHRQIRHQHQAISKVSIDLSQLTVAGDDSASELQHARNQLNSQCQELVTKFQIAQKDLELKKRELKEYWRRYAQETACALVVKSLQTSVERVQTSALHTVSRYVKFDERSHYLLQKCLAKRMLTTSETILRESLSKWFQHCFQPLQEVARQGDVLDNLRKHRMKLKLFCWLKNEYNEGLALKYQQKQAAGRIVRTYHKFYALRELSRSFAIWRSEHRLGNQKIRSLERLIKRFRFLKVLNTSFHRWLLNSYEQQCTTRANLCLRLLARTSWLNFIFQALKQQTVYQRQQRLKKLRLVFGLLKSSIVYKREKCATRRLVAIFRTAISQHIVQVCFNELRQNKELSKVGLLGSELHEKVLPQITELQSEIGQMARASLVKKRIQAIVVIESATKKRVKGYFETWRLSQAKSVQFRLFSKVYRQRIESAFQWWQRMSRYKAKQKSLKTITETQNQLDLVANQLYSQNHVLDFETQRCVQMRHQKFGVCLKILLKRLLRHYSKFWARRAAHLTKCHCKLRQMLNTRSAHLQRFGFNKYCAQVNHLKRQDRLYSKANRGRELRNQRALRKSFEAICQFVTHYRQIREHFRIYLASQKVSSIKNAFRHWVHQSRTKSVDILKSQQNQETSNFDSINKSYGEVTDRLTLLESGLKDFQACLMHQSRRMLANTFSRRYYVQESRYLQRWREQVAHQKHRERVIQTTISQQTKNCYRQAFAAFVNRAKEQLIAQIKVEVSQTQTLCERQECKNNFANFTNLQPISQSKLDLKELEHEGRNSELRTAKLVELLISTNQSKSYQSKKRVILIQWLLLAREKKKFCRSVHKVMTKSLWQSGFEAIRCKSTQVQEAGARQKHLEGMRRMFWKKACGQAFRRLREFNYANTKIQSELLGKEFQNETVSQAESHKILIWTKSSQALKVLVNRSREVVFASWKRYAKTRRVKRQQAMASLEITRTYWVQRALKRWNQRANQTRKCRSVVDKFQQKESHILLKYSYTALKRRYESRIAFMQTMDTISTKYLNSNLQFAFSQINFRAQARLSNTSEKATNDRARHLFKLLESKQEQCLTATWHKIKIHSQTQAERTYLLKQVFAQVFSQRLRSIFNKWKTVSCLLSCEIDVNDYGPIVEKTLEERLKFRACLDFMRDQAYTESQIQQAALYATSRTNHLLRTVVSRLRLGSESVIPRAFDRWILFVKMRKLVRRLLNHTENSLKAGKADLNWAFRRWQKDRIQRVEKLQGQLRPQLVQMCANRCHRQRQQDQQGERKAQRIYFDSLQRDDMLDHYISSQKLAVAVGRDCQDRAKAKAFSQLLTQSNNQSKEQLSQSLVQNIDLIQRLKGRMQALETSNSNLSRDNEELRQFSLDGLQIARSASRLSDERQLLLDNLAEKQRQIQSLLRDNSALTSRLESLLMRN